VEEACCLKGCDVCSFSHSLKQAAVLMDGDVVFVGR